jgi:chemotaxis protein methyltransferase CheR
MTLSAEIHREAEVLVERRLGLRLRDERRADLDRAVLAGLRSSGLPSQADFLSRLAGLPDGSPEWGRLAARLSVGETCFFRDRACFEALERHVLPGLVARRRAAGRLRLRLWSAACATGEEPYSLAMLLERLLPDLPAWDLGILATDINPEALAAARRGHYREWSLRGVDAEVRDTCFTRRGPIFELRPRIRRMVELVVANLAAGPPPAAVAAGADGRSGVDLILCRNALMYLTPEAARRAVAGLEATLARDGWLVVAPAEASAECFRPLVPVNWPGVIFFRHAQAAEGAAPAGRPSHPPRSTAGAAAPAAPAAPPRRGAGNPPLPELLHPPSPPRPPALLAEARTLADRGRLEEALRACQEAIGRDCLDAEAHRLLAAIQQERGETAAALAALRRALYLDPGSLEAHLALGALLLRCGRRERGLRHLATARRLESAAGSKGPA